MAWRSSGTTNDEMVDNLKRFQVISSPEVEVAFRSVDRRLFVPKSCQHIAHKDQPVRDGNIHISAPHIYGTVLEALDLKKDAGFSFLNAGSGTGYLTCIAASILGPQSIHYCVEIQEDVISHSKEAIAEWKKTHFASEGISNIDLIHGNALELNTNKGECALGFDRIYIGAAIQKFNLQMFKKMLKPGGILVGPVGDELVQIARSFCENSEGKQRFTTKVISGVRFAPLLDDPSIHTIIPARIWDPSNHNLYPDSFRGACNQLLLCSNASRKQPVKVCQLRRVNVASMLPRALWVEVLSFTHRNWFDVPLNEVDFLRRRLAEEQANLERANQAKQAAESRLKFAERERDIYKILARTLRSRVRASSSLEGSNDSYETIEATAAAMLWDERESLPTFGLGRVLRRMAQGGNDEEMGDDGDEDFEFSEEESDDEDNMSESMGDVDGSNNEEVDSDDDGSFSIVLEHHDQNLEVEGTSTISNIPSYSRKVSVSEEDLRL
mmetsp:Transcript_22890/g.49874  ORF Transcript_22890/g.49874 Transcript_22890/m.49874 type:complete len:496 (+) Transcript_22890:111-1598(+)|eukprot:CAMPEP_0168198808 /NCGR_PEP_ID=MMETSP0139_2-20121125/22019_1 /TAXON_ID=44445 /ORGANISM="Pseudo-nitzschia australis, Strain 10249 10 AB" /LENGTH=495 /DNA_ID=CAMNT_0008123619 /DNA_START=44 /DNA_END=1531 /DNA_ORIENTATION=+